MLKWILGYMCLFQIWCTQGICRVVGLLGHTVVLFLDFKGISTLFSIVTITICISNSVRKFCFLHTLFSFTFGGFFDDSQSEWCIVSRSPKYSIWVKFQKQQNYFNSFPKQTIQYHSNLSLCSTTNAKEGEVKWFCEDLQNI